MPSLFLVFKSESYLGAFSHSLHLTHMVSLSSPHSKVPIHYFCGCLLCIALPVSSNPSHPGLFQPSSSPSFSPGIGLFLLVAFLSASAFWLINFSLTCLCCLVICFLFLFLLVAGINSLSCACEAEGRTTELNPWSDAQPFKELS